MYVEGSGGESADSCLPCPPEVKWFLVPFNTPTHAGFHNRWDDCAAADTRPVPEDRHDCVVLHPVWAEQDPIHHLVLHLSISVLLVLPLGE